MRGEAQHHSQRWTHISVGRFEGVVWRFRGVLGGLQRRFRGGLMIIRGSALDERRQGNLEDTPLAHCTFHPNPPPVLLEDSGKLLHDAFRRGPARLALDRAELAVHPAAAHPGNRKDAAEFGFDDQFIYDELGKEMSGRQIKFENMIREEALPVFKKWKEKTDKTEY